VVAVSETCMIKVSSKNEISRELFSLLHCINKDGRLDLHASF